MKVDEFIADIR
jgi:hypothetical protein